MIPYELDPSLNTSQPEPAILDDGFSPVAHEQPSGPETPAGELAPVDPALWAKSAF